MKRRTVTVAVISTDDLFELVRDAIRKELGRRGPSAANHVALLTTAQAAKYCGFRSTAAIRKAVQGALAPSRTAWGQWNPRLCGC